MRKTGFVFANTISDLSIDRAILPELLFQTTRVSGHAMCKAFKKAQRLYAISEIFLHNALMMLSNEKLSHSRLFNSFEHT